MASLERRLGLFSVVTISMSSMIGSGIFVLPGLAFSLTGPSVYIAFLLSAICILPAALSKAELATAMPKSGGTYVYLERTFGPLAGTVTGLGLFLSILLKASFALIGFKAYLGVITTSFDPLAISLISLLGIIALNIFGVGKVSNILTGVLILTIISMLGLSISSVTSIEMNHFDNLFSNGAPGFFASTALVFVAFAGVTKVAAIAEEVKNPEKNLPRGILLSLVLVTIIYSSVSFILAGVLSPEVINNDIHPIFSLATSVGGRNIGLLFAIIATLTMINTSNAGILAASRFPFAMARDNLLPAFLGKLHVKYLTPIISIILSGFIIGVVLIFVDVTKIAKLASAFMISIYVLENLSVIVLREARTQWYRPGYKAPLYPLMQVFGILSGVALLFAMGNIAIIALLVIAIPGVLLYVFYSSKRTTRKGVIGIRGKRLDLINDYPNKPGGFCALDVSGNAEIIVSLFGRERSAEMLIEMGIAMTQHTNIEVAKIIEIPEQTDFSDMIEEPAHLRSLRRRIIAMANEKNESITFDPILSHDVSRTVFELSQRFHCKWLLVEWGGRKRGSLTFHNPIGWLKSHLHCNLAIFKDSGVRYIRKIMVLVNHDKNDSLVLSTAEHLSEVFWADVTLVKYASIGSSDEVKYEKTSYLKELGQNIKTKSTTKLVQGSNHIESLIEETSDHDLLILGSQDHSFIKSLKGNFDDQLIAKASCSVLAVHASSFN